MEAQLQLEKKTTVREQGRKHVLVSHLAGKLKKMWGGSTPARPKESEDTSIKVTGEKNAEQKKPQEELEQAPKKQINWGVTKPMIRGHFPTGWSPRDPIEERESGDPKRGRERGKRGIFVELGLEHVQNKA